jgi:hypothetical protein
MQRLFLVFLALGIGTAQAEIGWTYEQCVQHWGKPTDKIVFNADDGPHPAAIFKYGSRYIIVYFKVKDGVDISEELTDNPKF